MNSVPRNKAPLPNDPQVITAVPASPETHCRVIVRHAAYHIFRSNNLIRHSPEPKETPRYQQLWQASQSAGGDTATPMRAKTHLEPDDNQIPEPDHTDLSWSVSDPRLSILDRDNIHEV